MPRLKISWEEFVNHALKDIQKEYPNIETEIHTNEMKYPHPEFIKLHHHEGESSCYEIPDYVYINMKKQ